ncbi:hypothetical protein ACEK07_46665 [Alcanivoracaceae bacterium MT1]
MRLDSMQVKKWAEQNKDEPLLHALNHLERVVHDKALMEAVPAARGWCMGYLKALSFYGLITQPEVESFGREVMVLALHINPNWVTHVIDQEPGDA